MKNATGISHVVTGDRCLIVLLANEQLQYKMKQSLILFSALLVWACSPDKKEEADKVQQNQDIKIPFDQSKWGTKEGKDYPFRNQMLDDVVYNDTIRTLQKEQLLELLGAPDRINDGHLYYKISEIRLGFWTLKSKTMVIKLMEDNSIEWIKIHGG